MDYSNLGRVEWALPFFSGGILLGVERLAVVV